MTSLDALRQDIAALEIENRKLRETIASLSERLSFLETHRTLAAGLRGETLISDLVNGKITAYATPHDIEVTATGQVIEVKLAKLNKPVRTSTTHRWAWSKVFGESGRKKYDHLLLVGEADLKYREQYRDQGSPYVLFLVPYADVKALSVKTGRNESIILTTNPRKAKSVAAPLFSRFQVSREELRVFGLGG